MVNKCLAKDADQRYQNCGGIISDIDTREHSSLQPTLMAETMAPVLEADGKREEIFRAAIQSAIKKVGNSPLMIGEVQLLLGVIGLGFAYLLFPFAIMQEFINGAAKAAGERGEELRALLDPGQGRTWTRAFHLVLGKLWHRPYGRHGLPLPGFGPVACRHRLIL